LFQYVDERNRCRAISSGDVNEYLRVATGIDLTAKDFRTWAGTVLAVVALGALGAAVGAKAKRNIVKAVEQVSRNLGNTQAVCRKSYIHPAIIDSYLDGTLLRIMPAQEPSRAVNPHALTTEEMTVMKILAHRKKGCPEKTVGLNRKKATARLPGATCFKRKRSRSLRATFHKAMAPLMS
jgi:DNA topoisomerase-1